MRLLAVALAFVLAACSSADADQRVAVEGPGEERGQEQTGRDDLVIDEIDARLAAWEDAEPEAYRYVIDSICGCDWGGRFEVTVVAGEVVTAEPTDPDTSEEFRRYFAQSVEEMFAMFREAEVIGTEEKSAARSVAAFDDDLGYPTAFTVQWTEVDEPYEATISNFAVVDPSEVAAPDLSTVPLIISNQRSDQPDVRISVVVDGEAVVDGVFPVGNQHSFTTYDVPLEPGPNEVLATSDAGARLSQTVEVIADEPLFLVLNHWTAEEPGQEPAFFDFTQSSDPPGFG